MFDKKIKPSGKMFHFHEGGGVSLNLDRIRTNIFRGKNATKLIKLALRREGVKFKSGSPRAKALKTWVLGSNQWSAGYHA